MPTPRIFIASSKQGRPLAESLAEILREEMGEEIEVREWWRSFGLGHYTLASLVENCQKADFAAVLLTKRDATQRTGRNCIFEAGLFTAAFAFRKKVERSEAERCFLLSSLPSERLFSDFHGIAVAPIEENRGAEGLHLAVAKIREAIRTLGPLHRPELQSYECYREEKLMDREQVGEDGHLDPGSDVLINLTRPIEVANSVFARRVFHNLQANVQYKYFFSASEKLRVIAQLVHSVATANPEELVSNLDLMQEQFRVWLLPSSKSFEFCIHNAGRHKAVCYLRRPEDKKFVQWCAGERAIEIGNDFERIAVRGNKRTTIFQFSSDFDQKTKKDMRSELEEEIKHLFKRPPDCERVLSACFGDGQGRDVMPRRAAVAN